MEKKRKLPPRAAARAEHASKRRTATPPSRSSRSATPAAPPAPEPAIEEPQLPKSITAGNPLPTVEKSQPDDLSSRLYQSIQESGVLAESLNRSRLRWIHEGIFEKYWTKPTKRKGVVKEEPNNPPKDSMTKIGTVTITVEPHVLEATMYAVKDPKPPAPTTNSTFRPIIQYGPPNGVMPPPPKPATPSTPSTPSAVPASPVQPPAQPPPCLPPQSLTQSQSRPATPSQPPLQPPSQHPIAQQTEPTRPPPATAIPSRPPLSSPRGPEPVPAAPSAVSHPPTGTQPPIRSPAMTAVPPQATPPIHAAVPQAGLTQPKPMHSPMPNPARTPTPGTPGASKPATPGAKAGTPTPAAGADPIIVTLAERASEDPHLRDLMKRVAVGEAAPGELQHFQKIIDQITAEYKRKGGQQGPSADRLLVDGRTVKYFADEVRVILDIVLSSNPNQKGKDLRIPPESDPLVILLVQTALDDTKTRELVRRVAEGKTRFSDATDLKAILDKLKASVPKHPPNAQYLKAPAPHPGHTQPTPNHAHSTTNPAVKKPHVSPALHNAATPTPPPIPQQALRSKGPPPNLRPDISAIVFEFHGGTGDRYLFPKYSMLDYQVGGSQVLASFLIVRKGSKSEYGGDPNMDYYQPVTIRVSSHSGRHLENLARVVAPQDEVRRYMDDIMSNMTRAEYVLLAMRLPRAETENSTDDHSETPKTDPQSQQVQPQPGVLWTSSKSVVGLTPKPVGKTLGEEEQYSKFIATVS